MPLPISLRGFLLSAFAPLVFFTATVVAQIVGIGTIEGRVSNARTGEFMERARVTVEGTALETFTDSAGQFRLTLVPSGVAKIRVFLPGRSPRAPR